MIAPTEAMSVTAPVSRNVRRLTRGVAAAEVLGPLGIVDAVALPGFNDMSCSQTVSILS